MSRDVKAGIPRALARIPSGMFVLTAEHEDRRLGTLVSLVQRVCELPPMVSVAVPKGEPIMPLISESRHFGLCQIPADDRVMRRKFAHDAPHADDPFLGLEMSGGLLPRVPVLASSLSYMECELMRHMDVEGDHDLFIGVIKAAGGRDGDPFLHSVCEAQASPAEGAPPTSP